jgi:hypothetical protein
VSSGSGQGSGRFLRLSLRLCWDSLGLAIRSVLSQLKCRFFDQVRDAYSKRPPSRPRLASRLRRNSRADRAGIPLDRNDTAFYSRGKHTQNYGSAVAKKQLDRHLHGRMRDPLAQDRAEHAVL